MNVFIKFHIIYIIDLLMVLTNLIHLFIYIYLLFIYFFSFEQILLNLLFKYLVFYYGFAIGE